VLNGRFKFKIIYFRGRKVGYLLYLLLLQVHFFPFGNLAGLVAGGGVGPGPAAGVGGDVGGPEDEAFSCSNACLSISFVVFFPELFEQLIKKWLHSKMRLYIFWYCLVGIA